jgi:hypothetical protein
MMSRKDVWFRMIMYGPGPNSSSTSVRVMMPIGQIIMMGPYALEEHRQREEPFMLDEHIEEREQRHERDERHGEEHPSIQYAQRPKDFVHLAKLTDDHLGSKDRGVNCGQITFALCISSQPSSSPATKSGTLPAVSLRLNGVADEVVVVDSHSTDGTQRICEELGVRFLQREWDGYSPQRNFAVDAASNDWVLAIDADEAAFSLNSANPSSK